MKKYNIVRHTLGLNGDNQREWQKPEVTGETHVDEKTAEVLNGQFANTGVKYVLADGEDPLPDNLGLGNDKVPDLNSLGNDAPIMPVNAGRPATQEEMDALKSAGTGLPPAETEVKTELGTENTSDLPEGTAIKASDAGNELTGEPLTVGTDSDLSKLNSEAVQATEEPTSEAVGTEATEGADQQ
ncbi:MULTISPECIES: hypothetical protein [unclassified Paraflavitalea]|uniref:hypothetical protein n=1 Tax=unclassified Paraflavitalea TaxID=2798305 RepID=UPI003D32F590